MPISLMVDIIRDLQTNFLTSERCMKILAIIVTAFFLAGCNNQEPLSENQSEETSVNDKLAGSQPNIIVIVADDLGYTDTSTFGGSIPSPNIDSLAQEGIKLGRFYTSLTCSPTRSMLLTGVDNHLAGLGNMAETVADNQKDRPGYEGYLNESVTTMATILKDAGYHTYMAGKWHLGLEHDQSARARGFERSFILLEGGASHWSDMAGSDIHRPKATYREDGELIDELPEDFYSTDFYTDKMLGYIDSQKSDGKPVFAYFAYTSPHWPLHAPDRSLDKFVGKYDEGYDVIRAKNFERAKKMGFTPKNAVMPPRPNFIPAWDSLPEDEKIIRAKHMEAYAAMVDNLDENIGRVLSYLKDNDMYENTLIVFMSDNGADAFDSSFAPTVTELADKFDNSPANIGRRNSYSLYGPFWAHASEAPYRLFKTTSAEGGYRVPAIVSYPVSGTANKFNSNITTVLDIFPTVMELAGTTAPLEDNSGNKKHVPSGNSLLPLFEGADQVHPDDYVYGVEIWGRLGIVKGPWKLLRMAPPFGTGEFELFNLSEDLAEQNNLADSQPEKLDEMVQEWESYVARLNLELPEGPFQIKIAPPEVPVR